MQRPVRRAAGRAAAGFTAGLLLGVLVAAGGLATLARRILDQGLVVRVNTDRLAQVVSQEVQTQAERSLPSVLLTLRRRVPPQLASELAARLGQFSISFSGVTLELPPSVQRTLDRQMQMVLEHALRRYLDSMDVTGLARRLGTAAAREARQRVSAELVGHRFYVYPYPWLKVPVVLMPLYKSQAGMEDGCSGPEGPLAGSHSCVRPPSASRSAGQRGVPSPLSGLVQTRTGDALDVRLAPTRMRESR